MIACADSFYIGTFWLAVALAAVTLIGAWFTLGAAQKRERTLVRDNRKLARELFYAETELEITREWHG